MILQELPFQVENVRFEIAAGGYATIWFDLTGARFSEPEAMTNMLVDFEDFLADLLLHAPVLYAQLYENQTVRHEEMLEQLDAKAISWPVHLHGYVARQLNLEQAENERVGWLNDRRRRAEDTAWEQLTRKGSSEDPSWDEVANRLIDDMNIAATELYPEILDFDAETNNRLREILESHTWRLANEVVGLVQEARKQVK